MNTLYIFLIILSYNSNDIKTLTVFYFIIIESIPENLLWSKILFRRCKGLYKISWIKTLTPGFIQKVCIWCSCVAYIIHCTVSTFCSLVFFCFSFYQIYNKPVYCCSVFSTFVRIDTRLICFIINNKNLHLIHLVLIILNPVQQNLQPSFVFQTYIKMLCS